MASQLPHGLNCQEVSHSSVNLRHIQRLGQIGVGSGPNKPCPGSGCSVVAKHENGSSKREVPISQPSYDLGGVGIWQSAFSDNHPRSALSRNAQTFTASLGNCQV
jgi:hypothetical protein